MASHPPLERVIIYTTEIIFHYHFYQHSQDMASRRHGVISTMYVAESSIQNIQSKL